MSEKKDNLKNISIELNMLQKSLPGGLSKHQDIFILALDPETGTGHVRFNNLQSGINTYDFDITLNQDAQIPIDAFLSETLQFVYSIEGAYAHKFNDSDNLSNLEQYQTGVAHNMAGQVSSIIVKQGERLVLNIVSINKRECFTAEDDDDNNEFGKKLQHLLDHMDTEPNHFHLGNYNLRIANHIKQLNAIEYTNEISEFLSQKGRYYLILAEQIDQFYNEIEDPSSSSELLKYELKKIAEVSETIKQKPELPHSIKSLCKQTGLSPAKLQSGFKFIYGRTVSDFIRNVRIEKAEVLIRTSDMNISEIVYSIGLTSRSYFCKIFKQKYKCNPKDYRTKRPHHTFIEENNNS